MLDGSTVAREAANVGVLADVQFPVDSFREAAPHLRRPFTPEAIKFKVQSVWGKPPSGCLIVAYIDARLVIERLNLVCPQLWSPEYQSLQGNDRLLLCRLTVDGITRSDVGESPKKLSKDVFSDALKRAAVHFGVGVSLYALPQIRMQLADARGRIEKRGSGDKETIVLTDLGHERLRASYAAWLESTGEARFGPALDHGDVEGGTVDPDSTEEPEVFVPAPAAAVEDTDGEALIAACRAVYDEIRALGGGLGAQALPPGQFNGSLQGAWHSHEQLRAYLAWLETRRGELTEMYANAGAS